jgi:hypothetical protein
VGFSRFFPADEDSDPRTLVEAVADGWWYTAALTGNRRVATFMTDPDIARQYRLDRESSWREALEQTRFIRSAVPTQPACGEMVRPAGSAYLEEPAGDGWIAVGDAACAHDLSPDRGSPDRYVPESWLLTLFPTSCATDRRRVSGDTGNSSNMDGPGMAARRRYYLEEQRWPNDPSGGGATLKTKPSRLRSPPQPCKSSPRDDRVDGCSAPQAAVGDAPLQ